LRLIPKRKRQEIPATDFERALWENLRAGDKTKL
jgi:hypothetical protein